jgi:hypothetical protein
MPEGLIEQPTGARLESYCVDSHSRTGYSGSPAFVYRSVTEDLRSGNITMGSQFIALLGIHWGQFIEDWEIGKAPNKSEANSRSLVTEGGYVRGLSGMTCIIPAWAIKELLDRTGLSTIRDVGDSIKMADQIIAGGLRQAESQPSVPETPNASADSTLPTTEVGD